MILYHCPSSIHSRFVLLVARNLDIDIDLRSVVLSSDEQFSKEFTAINPRQQVPVLADYDYRLTESRAIACYLANMKPGNKFYPTEPLERAWVDMFLYMDATYVVPTWYNNAIAPILSGETSKISLETRNKVSVMLSLLEEYLKNSPLKYRENKTESPYFAGESVTLADMSILGTIGLFYHLGEKIEEKYPFLHAWFKRMQNIEGWNEHDVGAQMYARKFKKYWSPSADEN
ncbi:CLUMA_CG019019, isoform A [Clunio marinus]|uniref:glutathione transferase n=1 Tax=Clunio marinus TaxID=568069 RepID=A0A1J1J4W2_9DIPT|nr:CLUMA_CG019019, isoform A [Clunio marinus]